MFLLVQYTDMSGHRQRINITNAVHHAQRIRRHVRVRVLGGDSVSVPVELIIRIPTDVLVLPTAPGIVVGTDSWHVPLDVDYRASVAAAKRTPLVPS